MENFLLSLDRKRQIKMLEDALKENAEIPIAEIEKALQESNNSDTIERIELDISKIFKHLKKKFVNNPSLQLFSLFCDFPNSFDTFSFFRLFSFF